MAIPPVPSEWLDSGHVAYSDVITLALGTIATVDEDESWAVPNQTYQPLFTIGTVFELTGKIGPPTGPNLSNVFLSFNVFNNDDIFAGAAWDMFRFTISPSATGVLELACGYRFTLAEGHVQALRIPYDPNAHKWLRFTVAGGLLHWRASFDGLSWEELTSVPWAISSGDSDRANVELDFSADDTGADYDGLQVIWGYYKLNQELVFGEEPLPPVPDRADPDLYKSAGVCVEVTGEGHVLDIAVGLWVKHPQIEDLEIWLRGPAPHHKRALLVDHNGTGADLGAGYEDHQITIFEDDGVNGPVAGWSNEFSRTGNYVPITSLTDTYVGLEIDNYANGWWCIDVIDTTGGNEPVIWEYCLYIVSDRIPLSPLGQLWPRGGGDRMIDALNTKFRERQLLTGNGRPFSDVGEEGDLYYDERTTILYGPKGAEEWDYENVTILGQLENTVVVYEQPNRPSNARLGSIWLDTDG